MVLPPKRPPPVPVEVAGFPKRPPPVFPDVLEEPKRPPPPLVDVWLLDVAVLFDEPKRPPPDVPVFEAVEPPKRPPEAGLFCPKRFSVFCDALFWLVFDEEPKRPPEVFVPDALLLP